MTSLRFDGVNDRIGLPDLDPTWESGICDYIVFNGKVKIWLSVTSVKRRVNKRRFGRKTTIVFGTDCSGVRKHIRRFLE